MYIIGDIHGCFKTFMALIEKLPTDDIIFLTGDLIDRGPRSKEVVQWVIDNSDKCKSVTGNHEQMLLNVFHDPSMTSLLGWLDNGGKNTLNSYFPESNRDVKQKKARKELDIPEEHLNFFESLPLFIEEDDVFITHAGWNPKIPWETVKELNDENGYFGGFTWYRGLPTKLPNDKFHVFGHTPLSKPEITNYSANIDTGAVFTNCTGGGKLTALHYPSLEIYQQENIDYIV